MHVCTWHAEALQLALPEVMPKVEHCLETLLNISASSIFAAVLLTVFMGCMLPAMWISGETRCPSGAYMSAAKQSED